MDEDEEIAASAYYSDLKAERQETPHTSKPALAFEEGAIFGSRNGAVENRDNARPCFRIFHRVGNDTNANQYLDAVFLFPFFAFFLRFDFFNLCLNFTGTLAESFEFSVCRCHLSYFAPCLRDVSAFQGAAVFPLYLVAAGSMAQQ